MTNLVAPLALAQDKFTHPGTGIEFWYAILSTTITAHDLTRIGDKQLAKLKLRAAWSGVMHYPERQLATMTNTSDTW